jgi:hypothetical protein
MYEFLVLVVCAAGLSVVLTLTWHCQHYTVTTIKWTAQIMFDLSCPLGLTALLNTLFWNSLSSFAYSERPCFTPINWYNCLKHNVYTSSFIIFSVAEEDHSNADCLLVTVLTHGETSKFLYAQDSLYNVEDLWLPFTGDKCLSLAGKPKIFIIQVI